MQYVKGKSIEQANRIDNGKTDIRNGEKRNLTLLLQNFYKYFFMT